MRLGVSVSAACAFALALVAGCSFPATQLLVVVDSDYLDEELSTIEVRTYEVDEFRASFPESVPVELRTLQVRRMSEAGVDIPFSFGVVPLRGDASRRVVIELTAFPRAGARVVVRAITGFVPRETRRVPMFISRNCEGVVCGVDQTCDESGQCVPATVAPGPPVIPGEEFDDAGVPVDAHLGMDAFRADAYVPPGVDADLDAPPDPDAYADPDAWAADAYVPPGLDAPFPDAYVLPDVFVVPDAFSIDAFTPIDAWAPDAFTSIDAALDARDAPDAPDAFEFDPDAYDAEAPDANEDVVDDASSIPSGLDSSMVGREAGTEGQQML
ncbi:MAG: hypothetical protein J0L92_30280 [Deltaproteobacteria bacterium]|nr:hypothetical protein [Deltaproteobacteria bacterium]